MRLIIFTLIVALAAFDACAQPEYIALRAQGRAEYIAGGFEEAEKLLRSALQTAEAAKDDAAIAVTQNYLGDVYQDEERFEDAELAYARALRLFQRTPRKVVDTAAALRNLASAQSNDRRPGEALANLNRAVSLLEKVGIDKPDLKAEILNSMAMAHFQRRDFKKAERLLLEAMQIRAVAGIAGNRADAQIANNLASVYHLNGQYMKAEQWYTQSLEATARLLGSSHPDLTLTLANLGQLYADSGRYPEAIATFRKSLDILEVTKPTLDARIIRVLRELGYSYRQLNDMGCAQATVGYAIERARRSANPVLPDLIDDHASILQAAGRQQEALTESAEARQVRAEMRLRIQVQKH